MQTLTPICLLVHLSPHRSHACYVYPPTAPRDPCAAKTCNYGARCEPTPDGRGARCVCPGHCDSHGDATGSGPVCGTDGREYGSACELHREACEGMREVGVKYHGKCGE